MVNPNWHSVNLEYDFGIHANVIFLLQEAPHELNKHTCYFSIAGIVVDRFTRASTVSPRGQRDALLVQMFTREQIAIIVLIGYIVLH